MITRRGFMKGVAAGTVALAAGEGGGAEAAPQSFVNGCGMKMIAIPAGTFTMGESNPVPPTMGGPVSGAYGDWDEIPAHRVTISQPFHMSETEVTAEQFA